MEILSDDGLNARPQTGASSAESRPRAPLRAARRERGRDASVKRCGDHRPRRRGSRFDPVAELRVPFRSCGRRCTSAYGSYAPRARSIDSPIRPPSTARVTRSISRAATRARFREARPQCSHGSRVRSASAPAVGNFVGGGRSILHSPPQRIGCRVRREHRRTSSWEICICSRRTRCKRVTPTKLHTDVTTLTSS